MNLSDIKNGPKIASIDLETTPQQGWFWGDKWETNIIDTIKHTKILSFSFKIVGGEQITRGWIDYKGRTSGDKNEEEMIKELVKLINNVDIITGHNIKSFDIRVLNSRLAFYKMDPLSPKKVVDTKTEAKKYLKLPSYSLDDVCNYFGIPRKLRHEGFPMWLGCMAWNLKDWATMLRYNKHDVKIQEEVYLRIRPFMAQHPNIGMYTDKLVCPKCGSGKVQSRGTSVNQTTSYKRIQCQDCGGWGKGPIIKRILRPITSL